MTDGFIKNSRSLIRRPASIMLYYTPKPVFCHSPIAGDSGNSLQLSQSR
ncbi:hypothetical protein HMPREF1548_04895 [Clostridium sp. KLE 1755]|nr:hypothetical protein HMPREF1548_04895 [Clostridium sp. KLE 1755]